MVDQYDYNSGGGYDTYASFQNEEEYAARMREEKRQKTKEEAKKIFSRISLYNILLLLVAYAVVIGFSVLISAIADDPEHPEYIFNMSYDVFSDVISALSLNVCAMGVIAIIMGNLPSFEIKKKKISTFIIPAAFCVCVFASSIGLRFGTVTNGIINGMFGIEQSAVVEQMMSDRPVFEMIIMVSIIPGITEEYVFRKLIIDKTVGYSRTGSILFSALAFGFYHGNFEQFFYAFFIGIVFGYVYTETGNILYTMGLHAFFNFFCGIVPSLLGSEESAVYSLYIVIHSLLYYAGIAMVILFFVRGKHRMLPVTDTDIELKGNDIMSAMFNNAGFIVYAIFSAVTFVNTVVSLSQGG